MVLDRILFSAAVLGSLLITSQSSLAADVPPAAQLPGDHSTISTSDGSIRDDELAAHLKAQLTGKQVHDVKIFLNSCYGGGVLDDVGGALDMLGIPWVGGAASSASEPAWGPSDGSVGTSSRGSYWTDELVKAIGAGGAGDKVGTDIMTANSNDPKNPTNTTNANMENPQFASGSGGENITWNGASKHEVIVFGGKNNRKRHDNNIDNVKNALTGLLGAGNTTVQTSATDGTTTQNLKDMITEAAGRLDADTQLVLYFDDHGDTEFDFDEFLKSLFPLAADPIISIDPNAGTGPFDGGLATDFNLHSGWIEGLAAMDVQPGDKAEPFLKIEVDPASSDLWNTWWRLELNSVEVDLPLRTAPGSAIEVPLDWTLLRDGGNLLEISPIIDPVFIPSNLILSNLELASGAINEIDEDAPVIPEPTSGTLAVCAFLVVLSLRRRERNWF